jgi:predicted ATPase/DNA-binding CsgD family transcriptional regulator
VVDPTAELSSFVGRRQESARARALVADARLVTLTGVGGVGKTRLALRVAGELRRSFQDGVWRLDLSTVEPGEPFADRLASALGRSGEPGKSELAAAERFLAGKRVLLVLDNCEHVLDECAALIGELLAAADGLRVLCTSRQPLGIPGERVFGVPPLPVPVEDQRVGAEELAEHDSVRLFLDRAGAVQPDFALTEQNADAVARLCRRLDGIPLAIELAAARLRAFSVEEILDRLGDQYAVLTAGSRIALPRQRTLRASIDWSFGLCSPAECALWARLSVFAGGFDLPAIEAVCGAGFRPEELFDLVGGLVEKSLLARTDVGGGARYRMLETIRQYGRQRLAESGEETQIRRRHRDWCLWLVERSGSAWDAPDSAEWAERLTQENANLRLAVDFCLTEPGEAQIALVLTSALCSRRQGCGSLGEGRRWLDRVLALAVEPTAARAEALWVNAWLALLQGDADAAAALLRECRELGRWIGDPSALAHATQFDGLAVLFGGDPAAAAPLLAEAVRQHQELGDKAGAQLAFGQLTMAHCFAGDAEADEHVRTCLEVLDPHRSPQAYGYALWYRAVERWRAGDPAAAVAATLRALGLDRAHWDTWLTAVCLETMAWAVGDPRRAARLLGAAESVRAEIGAVLAGLPYLAEPHQLREAELGAVLGAPEFAAEHAAGLALDRTAAVALAVSRPSCPAPTRPRPRPVYPRNPLTRREQQIATLVADGLSNREIAASLAIAQRTAESHVEHILAKLGFGRRTQIAAWAAARADQDEND